MALLNQETMGKLTHLAERRINTLLTGAHGIGKTTMFSDLCQQLGMVGAYINVPSSDYFVDWLGIPSPDMEPEQIKTIRWFTLRGADTMAYRYAEASMGLDSETAIQIVEFIKSQAEQHRLNFLRPKRLEGVQFVFFDELNREADPRFLDSCMELVQFRSINGQPVPSLELVWGAQNPPNSIYKVRTLDVPLVDKFGAHIALEGNPDIDWYVSKGYNPHTVATVVSWYNSDLDEDEREVLSPRALENIMRLVDNGVDPEFGLLEMAGVRGHLLTAKLHRCDTSHRFAQLDLVTISANPLEYIEYAKNDIDFCAFFSDLVRSEQNPTNVLRVIPVWMAMTHDFQNKCLTDADWVDRMFNALGNVAALSSEVTTLPGYHNFAEMIKQFH